MTPPPARRTRKARKPRTERVVEWHKNCRCMNATASGPRFICRSFTRGDAFIAQMTLVDLACDTCDTPWKAPAVARRAKERKIK